MAETTGSASSGGRVRTSARPKEAAMSTANVPSNDQSGSVKNVDMKVEVIVIPVSDVDRAKEFYRRLGWRLDVTPPVVVQFTPHGSSCSVQFGASLSSAT